MYVRLAFAVAAHLEPEILIVDEVLAVGDAAFQRKCLGKMERRRRRGPDGAVREPQHGRRSEAVRRSMLLGAAASRRGPDREVIQEYLAGIRRDAAMQLAERATARARAASASSHRLRRPRRPTEMLVTGEDAEIVLDYTCPDGRPMRNVVFALGIYTVFGGPICTANDLTGTPFAELHRAGRSAAASRACRSRRPLPVNVLGRRQASADWVPARDRADRRRGRLLRDGPRSRRATRRCSSTRTGWSRRAPVRDCPPDCPARADVQGLSSGLSHKADSIFRSSSAPVLAVEADRPPEPFS